MLPLVLLIKSVLLLIIFQISVSFNLLVANWRLLPEFWSPELFFTHHGNLNGRSLERCLLAWASLLLSVMIEVAEDFHDPLPIRQVRMKRYLPRRRIYLSPIIIIIIIIIITIIVIVIIITYHLSLSLLL